jgi:hypothetical protein
LGQSLSLLHSLLKLPWQDPWPMQDPEAQSAELPQFSPFFAPQWPVFPSHAAVQPASSQHLPLEAQERPLAQVSPERQDWPGPTGEAQLDPLALHTCPDFWHELGPWQLVRQRSPSQRSPLQLFELPARQLPLPSHFPSPTALPLLQLALLHTVPLSYFRHAPAPSQKPSLPQLFLSLSVQSSSGSVPALTGRQRPSSLSFLALLQAWHPPAQALSQQTPSTQNPEVHSAPSWQAPPPLFWVAQLPPLQKFPGAQAMVGPHPIWQWVPSQGAPMHEVVVRVAGQLPWPSQKLGAVYVPAAEQLSAAQMVSLPYLLHAPVSSQ